MPNNESTTKFRVDISQLKTAMQQAQREVKLANAQFKNAASTMDDWSKNAEGLQAKLKQLSTIQGAQRKQLSLLEDELALTAKEYGENSAQADNLRIRIENQKAALNNTTREIEKYTKELDDCGKETDQLGDETLNTSKEVVNASDGFTVMKGALADLVASGIKLAIDGLKNLASAAYEAYQEFDKGADNVIKTTGATGEAAKALEESYKNVAQTVVGDLGDIGNAVGEVNTRFGLQGKDLEDLSTLYLKFADITGSDVVSAIDDTQKALSAYGLGAKDANGFLDVLARTAQNTGASTSTLANGIVKNATAFQEMGLSIEQASVFMGQLETSGVDAETVLNGMRKALKNSAKDGKNLTDSLLELQDSIENGTDSMDGLNASYELFGKSGDQIYGAIQNGTVSFRDLTSAASDAEGAVTDTYEATRDGFDEIQLALQSGKVEMGQFISDLATEYQDEIVDFINKAKKKLQDFIKWIIRNGDLIIETIKSIGKVMATIFVVKKMSDYAKAITSVISAIKGVTAATTAASTATTALSGAGGVIANLVSPGGAIVLGLAAIATTTYTLIKYFGEEKESIDVLTQSQKESIEASHQMKDAYDQMESSRQESMSSVQAEYGHYQELINELDTLVDENGKVKTGYEDRANFIMTTLNQALGMEMTMQDGIIENYKEERESITQLIELKKAEAILQANETAYTEALQQKTEATQTYLKAQETFNEVLAAAEEQAVKVNEAYMEMAQIEANEGVDAAVAYQKAHEDVFEKYQQLQVEVTNTRSALQDATTAYEGYNTTIQNYEGLSSAIISGDSQKINDALLRTENGLKNSTTTTADQLKKQADLTQQNYERLKKAYDDGDKGIQKQEVDNARELAKIAKEEYNNAAKETVAGYSNGLKDNSIYAEQAAKNLGYDSYEAFNESLGIQSPSTKAYNSGQFFAQGFINGMDSKGSSVYQKAIWLAQKAVQGLKDGQKEGSPSKITTQSGVFFTQGFINGIGSMEKELLREIKSMVSDSIDVLGSRSVLAELRSSSQEIMRSASAPISLGSVDGIRSAMTRPSETVNKVSTVNNNYNLVQNNTSPKSLSALETYQARRQQIAMIKAIGG